MGSDEMLGDVSVWFDLGYFLAVRDSSTEVLTDENQNGDRVRRAQSRSAGRTMDPLAQAETERPTIDVTSIARTPPTTFWRLLEGTM